MKLLNKVDHRAIDITGERFGKLIVIGPTDERMYGKTAWKCKCDCGNFRLARAADLKRGDIKSCGCMKWGRKMNDLSNQRFGRLIALEPTDKRSQDTVVWKCRCDCGNKCLVSSKHLQQGTKSCGCRNKLEKGEAAFNAFLFKYKGSAKKRNLIFDLYDNEFRKLTHGNCYYCGIEPNKRFGSKRMNGFYVCNGIDRIDNSKGYTLDNCVSCCETCNRAKLQMGLTEFLNWICRVYSHSAMYEYT